MSTADELLTLRLRQNNGFRDMRVRYDSWMALREVGALLASGESGPDAPQHVAAGRLKACCLTKMLSPFAQDDYRRAMNELVQSGLVLHWHGVGCGDDRSEGWYTLTESGHLNLGSWAREC